MFKTIKQG